MKRKILITGINGLLGSHLAKRFLRDESNVLYGISRGRKNQIKGVTYIYGLIQNPKTYVGVPTTIDICIHTAAAVPLKEDFLNQENCVNTNILGTLELVKFLKKNNPHSYITYISTIYVYKPFDSEHKTEDSTIMPSTFYGLSKAYAEATVSRSGLKNSILRLASFYDTEGTAQTHQPLLYDWAWKALKNEDLIIWGTGNEKRNYLHIDDVVDAVVNSVGNKAEGIFNIASHQNLSTREVANIIVRAANSRSQIIIDTTKSIYAPITSICIEKAKEQLNFHSKISFACGIQKVIRLLTDTRAN